MSNVDLYNSFAGARYALLLTHLCDSDLCVGDSVLACEKALKHLGEPPTESDAARHIRRVERLTEAHRSGQKEGAAQPLTEQQQRQLGESVDFLADWFLQRLP